MRPVGAKEYGMQLSRVIPVGREATGARDQAGVFESSNKLGMSHGLS